MRTTAEPLPNLGRTISGSTPLPVVSSLYCDVLQRLVGFLFEYTSFLLLNQGGAKDLSFESLLRPWQGLPASLPSTILEALLRYIACALAVVQNPQRLGGGGVQSWCLLGTKVPASHKVIPIVREALHTLACLQPLQTQSLPHFSFP